MSETRGTSSLRAHAPLPKTGPALSEQGYHVGRVERCLYRVTDGTDLSALPDDVGRRRVLDAPPPVGHNSQRAAAEIAAANAVSNKVTHLTCSHHHADHAGASSLSERPDLGFRPWVHP